MSQIQIKQAIRCSKYEGVALYKSFAVSNTSGLLEDVAFIVGSYDEFNDTCINADIDSISRQSRVPTQMLISILHFPVAVKALAARVVERKLDTLSYEEVDALRLGLDPYSTHETPVAHFHEWDRPCTALQRSAIFFTFLTIDIFFERFRNIMLSDDKCSYYASVDDWYNGCVHTFLQYTRYNMELFSQVFDSRTHIGSFGGIVGKTPPYLSVLKNYTKCESGDPPYLTAWQRYADWHSASEVCSQYLSIRTFDRRSPCVVQVFHCQHVSMGTFPRREMEPCEQFRVD